MDLLDGLDEIKVCTAYKRRIENQKEGEPEQFETLTGRLPPTLMEFGKWEAQFEKIKGWQQDTTQIKKFLDMPNEA